MDRNKGLAEGGMSPVVRLAVTIWYLQEWRRHDADVFQLKCAHSSPPLPRRVCNSSFASPRGCHRSETLIIASQSTVVRWNITYDCTGADTIVGGARQSWGKTMHCYFTRQHELALAPPRDSGLSHRVIVSTTLDSISRFWLQTKQRFRHHHQHMALQGSLVQKSRFPPLVISCALARRGSG